MALALGRQDGGEEDSTAVGADDSDGRALLHPHAAIGDAEVEVEGEDAVHPVVGEALPQFQAEQLHERQRVSEEAGVAADGLGRRGA